MKFLLEKTQWKAAVYLDSTVRSGNLKRERTTVCLLWKCKFALPKLFCWNTRENKEDMRLYIRNKEKYDPSKVGRALVFVEFPDPRVFSVGQVKEVIIIFVLFPSEIWEIIETFNTDPQRSVSLYVCVWKQGEVLSVVNIRPSKFYYPWDKAPDCVSVKEICRLQTAFRRLRFTRGKINGNTMIGLEFSWYY